MTILTTTHETLTSAQEDIATNSNRFVIGKLPLGCDRLIAVPAALLETHHTVIAAAQTRHAIATAAHRAAERFDEEPGGLVGYHLFNRSEHGSATRLHYCAPASGVARAAAYGKQGGPVALVIDQAHQGNAEHQLLLAAARTAMANGVDLKVVLLSARYDGNSLDRYLCGSESLGCVIVELAGAEPRWEHATKVEPAVLAHANSDTRLVAIVPTRDIADQIRMRLTKKLPRIPVVALHSDSDERAYRLAARWDGPIVIVTTEAPSAIPNIHVVVDQGRVHRSAGIEGVARPAHVRDTSLADCYERAGLASRLYVLCRELPSEPYPSSGLEGGGLAKVLLRLAADGLPAREIRFPGRPSPALRRHDLGLLSELGALDAKGAVTAVGRVMADTPLRPQLARMLVEARELGVAQAVLKLIAVLETRDLRRDSGRWRRHTGETGGRRDACDAFALLELYEAAEGVPLAKLAGIGVEREAFRAASRFYRRQQARLRLPEDACAPGERRAAVIRAFLAGAVQLFERRDDPGHPDGWHSYLGMDGRRRYPLPWSIVTEAWPRWIAGEAVEHEIECRSCAKAHRNWIVAGSAVDPDELARMFPERVTPEGRLGARGPLVEPPARRIVTS